MSPELFIARRYLRSKRQIRLINVIMTVSVVGIMVGVAALVIIMSVFNGFNGVVTSVLVGFDPHVRIEPARGKSMVLADSVRVLLETHEEIAGWAPYIQGKAILVSSNYNRVVYVKGVVDSLVSRVSGVSDRLVLGSMHLRDSTGNERIVLGLNLSDRLAATVGSEILLISPVGVDAMLLQFGQPESERFSVAGVYDSNNKDYDAHYAFISLEAAARVFAFGDGVSGIDLRVHDIDEADGLKRELAGQLGAGFVVSTWYDLHADLYAVMQIERWTAYIILCLIIAVAMFNVVGSLTMSVIAKRRDIGVLKAMGASRSSVTRVFLIEGVLVGLLGTLLGALIGLVVCYLQITYHLFPLDTSVYIIPAIPVDIDWSDIVTIVATSVLFSAAASTYPAMRAARLVVVDAIRWE
jgi:lipoprotein-releasing system permease protein